jgi:hypothetical protein
MGSTVCKVDHRANQPITTCKQQLEEYELEELERLLQVQRDAQIATQLQCTTWKQHPLEELGDGLPCGPTSPDLETGRWALLTLKSIEGQT